MTVDPLTLQAWLADARTALHKLLIGRQSIEVSVDGETVRYTRANRADLEAYIAKLEAQLAGRPTVGAIGIRFV